MAFFGLKTYFKKIFLGYFFPPIKVMSKNWVKNYLVTPSVICKTRKFLFETLTIRFLDVLAADMAPAKLVIRYQDGRTICLEMNDSLTSFYKPQY